MRHVDRHQAHVVPTTYLGTRHLEDGLYHLETVDCCSPVDEVSALVVFLIYVGARGGQE